MSDTADRHAEYDKRKLFFLSVVALVTAGVSFSVRSSVAEILRTTFFDPIDKLHSAEMIGAALGVAFLGFAFTIALASPFLDNLGIGRVLSASSLCFIAGTLIMIFAEALQGPFGVYRAIWTGMLLCGVGWGLVETAINPLATTLYPDQKTDKLNVLHAWWPAGIIIGGLVGLLVGELDLGWRIKLAVVLVPAVFYGVGLVGVKFPPTERVAAGVSTGERVAAGVSTGAMFREVARPMFVVWFLSMFLTAAAELAPGQWVDMALTRTVGFQGIWLLIYVSGLMFVMRHFAGTLAHRLSPVGLLWFSCLLASGGLWLLSHANSAMAGLFAATIWGAGVCFMWPTMLAAASERFPRGGALLMGLMGTGATLSIYFVLPKMGEIFDKAKVAAAGGSAAFDAVAAAAAGGDPAAVARLNEYLTVASQASFRAVAILPALLLVVFGAIWAHDRLRGGYRAVTISDDEASS
jgi:MFS family permease